MIRYTSCAGEISRIEPLGIAGHVVTRAKRVPQPVREAFARSGFGREEVEWDPKTKTARRLEWHERYRL